jgi:von Willebrand factor type A domain
MDNNNDKILIIFSDGQPTDGDPQQIANDLKNKLGVTIVSCYMTNSHIENPK